MENTGVLPHYCTNRHPAHATSELTGLFGLRKLKCYISLMPFDYFLCLWNVSSYSCLHYSSYNHPDFLFLNVWLLNMWKSFVLKLKKLRLCFWLTLSANTSITDSLTTIMLSHNVEHTSMWISCYYRNNILLSFQPYTVDRICKHIQIQSCSKMHTNNIKGQTQSDKHVQTRDSLQYMRKKGNWMGQKLFFYK